MNPLKNYCFGFWDILTATFLEDEAGPNTSVNAGTYLPNSQTLFLLGYFTKIYNDAILFVFSLQNARLQT